MAYRMKLAPMPADFEHYEHLRFPPCWKRTGGTVRYYDPVLIRQVGDDLEYAPLFAYLFHRWGMPNCPWVRGRSLASYLLTTPKTDMLLGVTPTYSGKIHGVFRFYAPSGTQARSDRYAAGLTGRPDPDGRPYVITHWADEDPLKDYALTAVKALAHFKRRLPLGEGIIDLYGPYHLAHGAQ